MEIRIKQLINDVEMNSAQFASEIGIAASSLHHIVSGRNNPSLDVIQKILQRFPNINAEWLINGKGEAYKNKDIIQKNLFDKNTNDEGLRESNFTTKAKSNKQLSLSEDKEIEKIIIFYKDKSFELYRP